MLEFYDFIIYALLASYISHQFFPTGNQLTSLIDTFITFSVGYLVRPIGGVLFGHFGDKYGRKSTFTFSILLMAIATFLIGLVPPYQHIGISAPIILTVLRILQGLSVGGEIPGAIAYVSESLPERKGLACGIIFSALTIGIVLGSLMHAILGSLLPHNHMAEWGWRIPFLIGGIFGFFSYLLRRKLEESTLFKALGKQTTQLPFIAVFQQRAANATAAIFVVGLGASIITLLFLFTPAYVSEVLNIQSQQYIWQQTLSIFLAALICIPSGMLADKFTHKTLLIALSLLTLLSSYPIFYIYTQHFAYYGVALFASAILTGFAWGIIPSLLSELFPTAIRYSGVAMSYNLGFAIFGGITPLFASLLIYLFKNNTAPTLYLLCTAILCLIALLFIKQRKLHFS